MGMSRHGNTAGCNHVRKFAQDYLKPIHWKEFERCEHGIEGYCRQCLPEQTAEQKLLDTIRVSHYADKPTINIPTKPKVKHDCSIEKYRYNLKGSAGFKTIDGRKEIERFRYLRKRVDFKIKNRCNEYGMKYEKGLIEDCFQDSLLEYYEHKAEFQANQTEHWHFNRDIYRLAWKHYTRHSRWLNHNSLEQIITDIEEGHKPDRAFYSVEFRNIKEENREFIRACRQVYTRRQAQVVACLLEGIPQYKIAKRLKVDVRTIKRDVKSIKLALSSGAVYSEL